MQFQIYIFFNNIKFISIKRTFYNLGNFCLKKKLDPYRLINLFFLKDHQSNHHSMPFFFAKNNSMPLAKLLYQYRIVIACSIYSIRNEWEI